MNKLKLFSYFLICFFFSLSTLSAAKIDVEARDLNGQDIKYYGGLIERGALVTKSTGNALAAGIKDGDIITAINNSIVNGIFELEEILQSIRGMRFKVKVQRVTRKGLLKLESKVFTIESAIDLQIQKAFTLDLETDTGIKTGKYQGSSLLLWHVNRVWVYDRQTEKEKFVSLLKIYSISEHKTYRYSVPEKVIYSDFLNEDGLLLYISNIRRQSYIGIIDIETGRKRVEWQFEIENLDGKNFDIKTKDINGDDISEIFLSVNHSVTCFDGATGNTVWVRNDLETYFTHERNSNSLKIANIYLDDFTRNGALELAAGPLLLNAATGEKKAYLSFDPAVQNGGILECRQLIGDPIPDIVCEDGLYDGNSGEKSWQPLRGKDYFLADLNGDGQVEIVYLLSDRKLHVHDIEKHKELYSINVDGISDLAMKDFNYDGFIDILIRNTNLVFLYQTNIPTEEAFTKSDRGIGYAASLLDYGMKKDRFYVFGKELYNQGKYKESVPLFMRSLSENPSRKEVVRYLATAFIKAQDIEGALSLLRHQQGKFVRDVLNSFSGEIVSYLLDRNETWQAIHFLEMRKDEDPMLLARCYLAVGRPEIAIKLLTEMESKPTEAQLLLGKAYVLTNKMISARIAYKNYLKYFPTSSEGWDELAALEAHEQNWEEAIEAHLIAMDLNPIMGNIGLAHFYLIDSPHKDLKLSLKYARTAHRIEPSNRTKLSLSECLVENGFYREANHFLSQINDPGSKFNLYEKLLQRCLYQNQAEDKYNEAEKLLLSPVFKKRNFKMAKSILNEIIDQYPKSEVYPLAHFRLGEVYLDPDHRDEQKAVYHFSQVERADHYLAEKASKKIKTQQDNKNPEELYKIETIDRPQKQLSIEIQTDSQAPETKSELKSPVKNNSNAPNKENSRRRVKDEKLKSVPFSLFKLGQSQEEAIDKSIPKIPGKSATSTEEPLNTNLTPEPIILQEDL